MLRATVLATVFVLVWCAVAASGVNADLKVALHVLGHGYRSCAKYFPSIQSCSEITYTHSSCDDIDVFVVFFDLTEVTVVEYGLDWPAEWGTCAYSVCAGEIYVGGINMPGDGIAQAYTQCHYGSSVILGYGWLLALTPGRICPIANPATNVIGTVDCDSLVIDHAAVTFCAGACGMSGCDPCSGGAGVPSGSQDGQRDGSRREGARLGEIKAMFR
jgi:hypothetical protein